MKIFKQLRKGQNIKENYEKIKENYNCRNKNSCPLHAKCLAPSITYGAKIPSNQINCKKKTKNIGTEETSFKHRFNNLTKFCYLEEYENDTAIQRILSNKQPFHIKSHLENNKEMRTLQHNQKKILRMSQ